MSAVRRLEVGEFTEEQLRVQRAGEALHRDGASPAGALELLAALTEDRTWERLADAKGRSFKGRFRDFVQARSPFGLGYDPDQLPKVLELRHPHESVPDVAYRMAAMREEVKKLLIAEIPPALPYGEGPGRGHTEKRVRGTNSFPAGPRSQTAEQTVRRLKRDDPQLAEKVTNGDLTPNAAAREKGWLKPRIILARQETVAQALIDHMPRGALQYIRDKLTDHLKED